MFFGGGEAQDVALEVPEGDVVDWYTLENNRYTSIFLKKKLGKKHIAPIDAREVGENSTYPSYAC